MNISIIIPCLNEEKNLENTLRHTLRLEGDFEVIVVDGGSTDATTTIANKFNEVKCLNAERGRGIQMNAGAEYSRGECLLFLHADTLLPTDALWMISSGLSDPKIAGGSFYLTFNRKHWLLKICSLFSRINSPLFTYGDQGIFVRTEIFRQIGGYRNWPILEDLEIQKRIRNKGRFVKLSKPVVTSARRFMKHGPVRQLVTDMVLVLFYKLGVHPEKIKKYYEDHRTGNASDPDGRR